MYSGDGPSLFQHDNVVLHKARSMKKVSMEEFDWPAQSPDLNPIKQLWDKWTQTVSPNSLIALVAELKAIPAAKFNLVFP